MAGFVTGMREPLSRSQAMAMRRLVLDHKASERRLRFPPTLHLARPGGTELVLVEESAGQGDLDQALRCDVVEAALRRAPDEALVAWLTRPGSLETQDVDLVWLRVLTAVEGETGRELPFVVVTRAGWRDPRTDVCRSWRRLRQR